MFKFIVLGIVLFPMIVFGSTLKCVVVNVDGSILPESTHNQVVLECDDVDHISIGDKVKVKLEPSNNKNILIEGC